MEARDWAQMLTCLSTVFWRQFRQITNQATTQQTKFTDTCAADVHPYRLEWRDRAFKIDPYFPKCYWFARKHGHEYASQVFFIRRSVQNVCRQCVGENQLSHTHAASECEWKTVIMAATNVSSMQSNVPKCEVIILATKKNCAIFPTSACNETVWIVSEVLLRLSASRSSYNAFLQFHKSICKLYNKVLYLSSFKRDIINT